MKWFKRNPKTYSDYDMLRDHIESVKTFFGETGHEWEQHEKQEAEAEQAAVENVDGEINDEDSRS